MPEQEMPTERELIEMEIKFQNRYLEILSNNLDSINASLRMQANDLGSARRGSEEKQFIETLMAEINSLNQLIVDQTDLRQNINIHINDQQPLFNDEELKNYCNCVEDLYSKMQKYIKSNPQANAIHTNNQQNVNNFNARSRISGFNDQAPPAEQRLNPVEKGQYILKEFRSRDAHPIRTLALKKINQEIFKDGSVSRADYLKMLLKADQQRDSKRQSGIKVFAKVFFSTNRHHPERQVLKLISEFKDGETPEAHKHNSDLLRKIDKICENALSPTAKHKPSGSHLIFIQAINEAASTALSPDPERWNSVILDDTNFIANAIETVKNDVYEQTYSQGYNKPK